MCIRDRQSSWLTEAFSAVLSGLCLFTPFEEFVNNSFSIPTLVYYLTVTMLDVYKRQDGSSICRCRTGNTAEEVGSNDVDHCHAAAHPAHAAVSYTHLVNLHHCGSPL